MEISFSEVLSIFGIYILWGMQRQIGPCHMWDKFLRPFTKILKTWVETELKVTMKPFKYQESKLELEWINSWFQVLTLEGNWPEHKL